jgi:pimeloyl-ACP methyl ester carboxylesterase
MDFHLLKQHRHFLFIVLITLVTVFLQGCSDTGNDPEPSPVYLISSEKMGTYTASQLQGLVSLSGFAIPLADLKYSADIFKVTYRTTYKNQPVTASGLVALPQTTKTVSLLSVHHGTITARSEAPSAQPLFSEQVILLAAFSSVGVVAVLPDYLGFGSSSAIFHPYYVSDLTASAVMDNLYAARELADRQGIKINQDVFLTGYSEGGYVTMAVHKHIELTKPAGINLVASFPAAGGYDVKGVQEYLFGLSEYANPYYLAYVALAYKSVYNWSQPLSILFNEPYASAIPGLFNGNLSGGQINAQLTTSIPALVQADVLTNIDTHPSYAFFADALRQNSLTNWVPQKPLFMYHGDADDSVPYSNSVSVFNTFIQQGASPNTVHLITLPGADHGTGVKPYIEDVVAKILDLLPNS